MENRALNTIVEQKIDELIEIIKTGGFIDVGNVDLSAYQPKQDETLNTTNKTVVGAINEIESRKANIAYVDDYTGGKKQRFVTQTEYDGLEDTEKNNPLYVWNIIDKNNELSSDSYIQNKPYLNNWDNIIRSSTGKQFKLIVDDEGILSTEPIIVRGNIVVE